MNSIAEYLLGLQLNLERTYLRSLGRGEITRMIQVSKGDVRYGVTHRPTDESEEATRGYVLKSGDGRISVCFHEGKPRNCWTIETGTETVAATLEKRTTLHHGRIFLFDQAPSRGKIATLKDNPQTEPGQVGAFAAEYFDHIEGTLITQGSLPGSYYRPRHRSIH